MSARTDHAAIATRVPDRARVLDVGCGNGELLDLLRHTRDVDARGLELDSADAGRAVARGLSVIQGDADTDLEIFPNDAFDVAILSKAIQHMMRPNHVLAELTRLAPRVIVSFRNYGYWPRRLSLLVRGTMPAKGDWYEESVLHACTVTDMLTLARHQGLMPVAAAAVSGDKIGAFKQSGFGRLNWAADDVIAEFARA
ncbi:MAG: methionine biosynthesis protein MetW [Pseudomonadota bacterium]